MKKGFKGTFTSLTNANWKWSCESEQNFREFVDAVRKGSHTNGEIEGLKAASEVVEKAIAGKSEEVAKELRKVQEALDAKMIATYFAAYKKVPT